MRSNVWISSEIEEVFFKALKRKRIDKIPAKWGNKDGFVVLSQAPNYVDEMVQLLTRGIRMYFYPSTPAVLEGTSIKVEVVAIEGGS